MTYATLDALRSDLGKAEKPAMSAAYTAKMLHDVPESRTVDRQAFIIERIAGKRVLELGASGPLHTAVLAAASSVIGIDREAGDGVLAFDLDDVALGDLPVDARFPELVLAGEVLEHLGNPGWLLTRLHRQYAVPLLISVPNAFSAIALKHMRNGTENVNSDHTAWYSYKTLRTLLERSGYVCREHYWHNGPPYLAESLIVVAE